MQEDLLDAQQLLPDLMALCGTEFGIFVHHMLEMIHHSAVGDECQRACQMGVAEFAGILAEEAVHPRPCEELHGHGVDFTAFQTGPDGGGRHTAPVQETGEGMACLVGDYFHVVGSAVEIGEDEGTALIYSYLLQN